MKKESLNSPYVVPSDISIEDAMKIITLNKRGAVVVVDKKGKVVGVASDGDIRRSLVHGVTPFAPISKAMNTTFMFIRKDTPEDENPGEFFKVHPNLTLVPVVNSKFVLSYIYKVSDVKD